MKTLLLLLLVFSIIIIIFLLNQITDKSLLWRKVKSFYEKPFALGYGSCGRCGRTWKFVKGHSTNYSENHGCFPLCENCWKDLTPEQRLPYYRDLFDDWSIHGNINESLWVNIKTAVLTGK